MMRLMCWLSMGVAVVRATAVPVPAQPAGQPPAQPQPVRRLADPLGRFTIEYPTDWTVNSRVVDAGKAGTVFSGFGNQGYVDVSLGESPEPTTAEGFGRQIEAQRRKNIPDYQQLQDGAADLAGNRAYYVYYTGTEKTGAVKDFNFYSLRVYLVIPAQRTPPATSTIYRVFWLTGGTRNDPQSVRDNVPLIQRTIWSFRPT